MVIGFGVISDCLSMYSNYNLGCWTPRQSRYAFGAFGFYFGGVLVVLGAVILVGRDALRLFGKLFGSGRASKE